MKQNDKLKRLLPSQSGMRRFQGGVPFSGKYLQGLSTFQMIQYINGTTGKIQYRNPPTICNNYEYITDSVEFEALFQVETRLGDIFVTFNFMLISYRPFHTSALRTDSLSYFENGCLLLIPKGLLRQCTSIMTITV